MEERKDIERLFQEKFTNFEVTPDSKVWNAIENKLQKKKKKRIIPIWWFGSGIAASLLISILVFNNIKDKNEPIINNENVVLEEIKKTNKVYKKEDKLELTIENEQVLVKQDKIKPENDKNENQIIQKNNEFSSGFIQKKNVAENLKKKKTDKKSEGFLSKEKKAVKKNFSLKKDPEKNESNDTLQVKFKKKDFIAELKKTDSVRVIKPSKNKWTVTSNFGVIVANSFSKTSPLDKSLASNTKGSNSTSFGVKIAYSINKKWAIQTGVYQQNIDYTAENLSVISNITSTNFSNANLNSDVAFISSSNEVLNSSLSNGTDVISKNATLQQTYGYIEIPVEVKYTLLENSKFNTNIISGFSTLFLNKNNLNLEANNTSQNIGKATNLNTVNFSGNFGIDFNYSITKKMNINLTPMFKVQMNTFSNSANGFKPYTIGIYSGLSYKF